MKRSLSFYLRLALLPAMLIGFSLMSTGFLSLGNIYAMGQTFAVITPVALAIGLTMIAGELDLSVGAMVALSGLIMVRAGGDSALIGIVAAIAFGIIIGALNAWLTLRLKVSSLVTTLGSMIVLQGASVWLEGGHTAIFDHLEMTDFLGLTILGFLSPWSIIAIILGVILFVVLAYTRLGRDIYAAGSDRKAALMSGTHIRPALLTVFVLAGVFASLDGVLMTISLGRASSQFGANLLIQSVTASILGGVALSGGVGRVSGIFLGSLILSVLSNGLSYIGADSSTILLANGGILLVVVLFESDQLGRFMRSFGQSFQTKKQN